MALILGAIAILVAGGALTILLTNTQNAAKDASAYGDLYTQILNTQIKSGVPIAQATTTAKAAADSAATIAAKANGWNFSLSGLALPAVIGGAVYFFSKKGNRNGQ